MRKSLLIALLLLGIASIALAAPWTATSLLTGGVVTDNTASAAVALPGTSALTKGIETLSVYIPECATASNVQVYGSRDGTNFYPIHSFNNGTNLVPQLSASDNTAKTMTIQGVDFRAFTHVKVKVDTANTADRTFTFMGYGPKK